MTQQQNIRDLLYFKGKNEDFNISIESTNMIKKEMEYNILVSIID